jgi:hypothetical protein
LRHTADGQQQALEYLGYYRAVYYEIRASQVVVAVVVFPDGTKDKEGTGSHSRARTTRSARAARDL